EFVGQAHGNVGVGDDAEVALRVDKFDDVRMPDIEDEHERAPARTALLDEAGGGGEQLTPADGARAFAVDALHVGQARTERGQVDADASAPGHDFHHVAQRVHDGPA